MNSAVLTKQTEPHWATEVVWRMREDPMSKQVHDKVIICEEFHTRNGVRQLAHRQFYHMVPVRATEISEQGCTLAQAMKVASDRKYFLVPDFLSTMVTLEIGFGIPAAKVNVVASGTGSAVSMVTARYDKPIWSFLTANQSSVMGDTGEMYGPETVFTFLTKV